MHDMSAAWIAAQHGFMGVPPCRRSDEAPARACIVGIPFDCGTHPFRVGAREGPDAIRRQSQLLRPFEVDPDGRVVNPTDALRLIDVGNVACHPGDIARSYPLIEQALDAIFSMGAMPISLGGDGAVTLPQLRAAARHHPGLAVLHIDAHTDTYRLDGYNTATTFTRAAEEQLIDVAHSVHLGTRGTTFTDGVIDFGRTVGYQIVPGSAFDREPQDWVARIKAHIGRRPVYLCFDMDIFDPSCAPGVCTPEWGGLMPKEGLALLRAFSGLDFVAFDINTVSPPQDVGDATAFLAATVAHTCCGLAAQAQSARDAA